MGQDYASYRQLFLFTYLSIDKSFDFESGAEDSHVETTPCPTNPPNKVRLTKPSVTSQETVKCNWSQGRASRGLPQLRL